MDIIFIVSSGVQPLLPKPLPLVNKPEKIRPNPFSTSFNPLAAHLENNQKHSLHTNRCNFQTKK
jgi:hypothetical protein